MTERLPTQRELVAAWLKEHGYGGLWLPDEPCGCDVDSLAPCDGDYWFSGDCEPAYRRECPNDDSCSCDGKGPGASCYGPKLP